MSADNKTNGPKLTGNNYHEWCGRAQSYLKRKGLYYVFEEQEQNKQLEQAYIRHVKKMILERNSNECTTFDDTAKRLIAHTRLEQDLLEASDELIQMLDAQDLSRVQGQPPAEMWETLAKTYKKVSATNVLLKMREIQRLRYTGGSDGNMQTYFAAKRTVRKGIIAAGGVFTEDQLQASILDGLGTHFKAQATFIRMNDTMTTEKIEKIENILILAEAKEQSDRQDTKSTRTHTRTDEHAPQEPASANMAEGGGKRGNKPRAKFRATATPRPANRESGGLLTIRHSINMRKRKTRKQNKKKPVKC
jgi:hypothetical protein